MIKQKQLTIINNRQALVIDDAQERARRIFDLLDAARKETN